MRTAVVRVKVDPAGVLSADGVTAGWTALSALAADAGATLIAANLAAVPVSRREVELLMTGAEADALQQAALAMCASAFGTEPTLGVLTFVSRGTDDDAAGVLAGFGVSGDIERLPGDDGWDVIEVTLRKADLERIPESRIHTALEASTNCEIRILVV